MIRLLPQNYLNGEFVSLLLYGTIIELGVLVSLEHDPPSIFEIMAILFVTLLGTKFAKFYSHLIGEEIRLKRTSTWEEKKALWKKKDGIASGLTFTLLVFAAAWMGLLKLPTAFFIAKWGCVFLLFLFGFLARKLSGNSLLKSLGAGLISAGIGILLVIVENWL